MRLKTAAEFRAIARQTLEEKWNLAVPVGLVATLLGGAVGGFTGFEYAVSSSSESGQQLISESLYAHPQLILLVFGFLLYVCVAALVIAVIHLLVGSAVQIGYARFQLDLLDRRETGFGTLFLYFKHWRNAVGAQLLRALYTFLWSLLFVIPGIVASYSYAMTDFILAEHPEIPASDAITISKTLMQGHKWRLFCLELSFIGWNLLSALTLGIGELWLLPYRSAATAAFFREITGTEQPAPSADPTEPRF